MSNHSQTEPTPNMPEAEWLQHATTALDYQAEHLDLKTQLALQRAREKALNHSSDNNPVNLGGVLALRRSRTPLLLGSALILAFALTLISLTPKASKPDGEPLFADLAVLSADAAPEELVDVEFYQWLELNE